MASSKPPETFDQHYSFENSRYAKIFEQESEKHLAQVEEAIKDLNQKMVDLSKQQKAGVLRNWCIEYSKKKWPRIGEVAYCVPAYYVNNYKDTATVFQESELRGDEAQRRVFNAFRLLNNHFERKGLTTMLIIGSCLYENFLLWLRKEKEALSKLKDRHLYQSALVLSGTKSKKKSQTETYFKLPVTKGKQRHEADIIALHPQKGVVFVQVKSVGAEESCDDKTRVNKIGKGIIQAKHDEDVFNEVMDQHPKRVKSTAKFVLAFPHLTRSDVETALKKCKEDRPQNFKLLCKEDLYSDFKDIAESEFNLENFQRWWDRFPNLPDSDEEKAERQDLIHDMAARYMGILSTPSAFTRSSERSHVSDVGDSIRLTGRLVKRLLLTDKMGEILKKKEKRVHLCGPPGAGKTMLLIRKGQEFAKTKQNVVFVVNMYRGFEGRPIGEYIYQEIEKDSCVPGKNVYPISVNVGNTSYANLFKEDVNSKVGKKPKCQLLFLVDEALPENYWREIMNCLNSEFKDSFVWCASGVDDPDLAGFSRVVLDLVYRIPPSVQHVLYNADLHRRRVYFVDSNRRGEIADNGPTAISIRHSDHNNKDVTVLDCEQCAEDLGELLGKTFKLAVSETGNGGVTAAAVQGGKGGGGNGAQKGTTGPGRRGKGGNGSKGGATAQGGKGVGAVGGTPTASPPLPPCTVAILFNPPSDNYHTLAGTPRRHETTDDDINQYFEKIESSALIRELRKVAEVGIVKGSSLGSDADRDKILVSLPEILVGFEWDIVVYVPGDAMICPLTGFSKKDPGTEETRLQSERETQEADSHEEAKELEKRAAALKLSEKEAKETHSLVEVKKPVTRAAASKVRAAETDSAAGALLVSESSPDSPQKGRDTRQQAAKQPGPPQAKPKQTKPETEPQPSTSKEAVALTPSTSSGAEATPGPSVEKVPVAKAATKRQAGTDICGLAHKYWRADDVKQFSPWDRRGLVSAAASCSSQLVMMIP